MDLKQFTGHAAMFGANSPYGHGINVQPPAVWVRCEGF